MVHFIPAWYYNNQWRETEQNWYKRRMYTEFDDTVKQIQLFNRNSDMPCQIMCLSYTPNFRHFLHRQGIFHVPYWSCFDAIQEVRRKKVRMLSYRNIKWPQGTEFVYSKYAVIAMYQGEKYAKIEFAEDGNPIEISMYAEDSFLRKNLYDDRGFVSSSSIYIDGEPVYREYYTDKGIWKMRHFFADGHVEINPESRTYLLLQGTQEYVVNFVKESYDSLGEVIREVVKNYIVQTRGRDIFCMAVHGLHFRMLSELLAKRRLVLSFYGERYLFEGDKEELKFLTQADYLVTDSKATSRMIIQKTRKHFQNMKNITPYDSRQDFGKSQSMSVQKILVPVDGIEDQILDEAIHQLAAYIQKNEFARVHLFSRKAEWELGEELLDRVRRLLVLDGYDPRLAEEQVMVGQSENRFGEFESKERFFVEQCVDELSVSKCIREQRVIVDLRAVPDVYLRISGISMGIPQIMSHKSQYVRHGKNGWLLESVKELQEALAFYLESQTNWNKAMIEAYEVGKNYSTARLIEQWDEVIKAIG